MDIFAYFFFKGVLIFFGFHRKRDFLQQIIEAADKEREEAEKTGGIIRKQYILNI